MLRNGEGERVYIDRDGGGRRGVASFGPWTRKPSTAREGVILASVLIIVRKGASAPWPAIHLGLWYWGFLIASCSAAPGIVPAPAVALTQTDTHSM